ncbi:MAG: molybdopterin-dependent oxidoreductase [Elusimicrobia bacterium]|nr:molybdopterin-dependent oxidoreductase [Elusimicrobiota bacterium]
MKIKFFLNKRKVELDVEPDKKVLYILKDLSVNSVRKGCDEEGKCGNCAILLDGKLVNSCMLIAPQIDGKNVTTVEGLSENGQLDGIQKAFIEAGVVQCGYCTPAQILAAKSLIDKVKKPTKEQIADAFEGVLCRCTGYKQIYNVFEILKGKSAKSFEKEYKKDYRVVGKLTPKIDAEQFVKADDAFVEDYVPKDALHLYILRSPHAHAEVVSIDTSEAEKMEGVEYILTHKNSPKVFYTQAGQSYPEPSPYDQQVISKKVRHIGDRVAAVAATSLEIAKAAAKKIKVKYKVLKPVFTIEDASREGAPIIHNRDTSIDPLQVGADPKRNIVCRNSGGIGDVGKGLKEADATVDGFYSTPFIQHTPLEPHTAYGYMKNGRLVIHTSVQTPFHVRRILAHILNLPENKIRIIKEKVGGGFGAKQDCGIEDIVGTIVYQSGKPVYYRMTRKEEFTVRTRPAMFMKIKAGAKKNGKITALSVETKADVGAYGPHALTVPMNGCSKTLPLFTCENMSYKVTSYYTNNVVSGAYQGYGVPQTNFAVQMTLGKLAKKLGMKYEDLILKNIVKKGYRLEILKQLGEGREGLAQKLSSCGLEECIKKGLKIYRTWRNKTSGANGEVVQGKGMAIMMQGSGIPGLDSANAVMKMISDGTFMLYIGGADLGTGEDTVAAKIAAEELGVSQDNIAVTSADTDTTPFDKGSYASSGTFFTGSAAYKAAKSMKERIIKATAKILGVKPSRVKIFPGGKVGTASRKLSFKELAMITQSGSGCGQLITSGAFTTQVSPIPYAAHFCQVSVNRRTGMVKVDKYYAVTDCGIPINPALARGQVYGAVLKTIGHTFYEALEFGKTGKCLNDNFTNYPIPGIKDVPEFFEVDFVEVKDPITPYVGKSIGELSCDGASACIGLAINDATGIWLDSWPFRPDRVLKELEKQKS